MEDVRESIVKLWARIINQEIAQSNFWFLKGSSWKDMDIIGIKPGNEIISLYNVKANLNTDSKKSKGHTPEKIAGNFIDTINVLNKAYNNNFKYNLYLIFESADRLGSRSGYKTTKEWLEKIKDKQEDYKEEIMTVLINNEIKQINLLILMSLYSCVKEIISKVSNKKKSHSFEFENEQFVYPFHKIPLLKFLDIYLDYNL